jgi:predicted nucleotide-binding protein
MNPALGINLLKKQIEKANDILSKGAPLENILNSWISTTRSCVEKVFGTDDRHVVEFVERGRGSVNVYWEAGQWAQYRHRVLRAKIAAVEGYIEELQIELDVQGASLTAPVLSASVIPELSKKVFIVHGHDSELKQATTLLVTQLGLEPVILHQQSKQGQTIIESLSTHASKSGFAIVLLTADDVGGVKGTKHSALHLRARQNVIFEMGLFIGILGRARVCAVYETGVERPSDLDGILYVKYDSPGQWRHDVAKEIQDAGYVVDRNKIP